MGELLSNRLPPEAQDGEVEVVVRLFKVKVKVKIKSDHTEGIVHVNINVKVCVFQGGMVMKSNVLRYCF